MSCLRVGDLHSRLRIFSFPDAIAFLGEFAGTTLFTLFAFAGTTVASLPATSVTSSGATADAGAVQPSPNTSSREFAPRSSVPFRRASR